MQKEKFKNLGYLVGFVGNLIMIFTYAWTGIETRQVYLVRGVGAAIVLAGTISLFYSWILKRKEQSSTKTLTKNSI
jgi:type II secretory pathway component PulM